MLMPMSLLGTGYFPSTNDRIAACMASTGAMEAAVAIPPMSVTLAVANTYVSAAAFLEAQGDSRNVRKRLGLGQRCHRWRGDRQRSCSDGRQVGAGQDTVPGGRVLHVLLLHHGDELSDRRRHRAVLALAG